MKSVKIVVKELIWNEKNIAHIAFHNIHPSKVEEVCQSNRIERIGHKNRAFLVGPTNKGRMLSVVLNPTDEAGVYYPVTAYEASGRSIQDYHEETRR